MPRTPCCVVMIHVTPNHLHTTSVIHVLMRDERRKEERSKQGQTNNKAKQHSTPKAVTSVIHLYVEQEMISVTYTSVDAL